MEQPERESKGGVPYGNEKEKSRLVVDEPWFRKQRIRLVEMLQNQVDFAQTQVESCNHFYSEILPALVENSERIWTVERFPPSSSGAPTPDESTGKEETKHAHAHAHAPTHTHAGIRGGAGVSITTGPAQETKRSKKGGEFEYQTHVRKVRRARYGRPVMVNPLDTTQIEYIVAQQARLRNMSYLAPVYVTLVHTTHATKRLHWPATAVVPSAAALAKSEESAPFPGPVWARLLPDNASEEEKARFLRSNIYTTLRQWEREFGRLLDVELQMNFQFFQVPVMHGSILCNGLAPYAPVGNELTGFFPIMGGSRVVSPISRRAHNEDFLSFRNDDKCAAELEIRADSKAFHSTATLRLQLSHRKAATPLLGSQIFVHIPFMLRKFYVAHIFLALGWKLEDIHPAIRKAARGGKWHPDFDVQIRGMLVASRMTTQEEALLFIARHSKRQQQIELRKKLTTAPTASAFSGMGGGPSGRPQPYLSASALHHTRQLAVPVEKESAQDRRKPADPTDRESTSGVEAKEKLQFARGVLDRSLLPQIGTTEESNFEKGLYLASMVYKLLAYAHRPRMIEALEAESDVGYIRYYGCGMLLGNLLRQVLGHYLRERKKQMVRLYDKQGEMNPEDRHRITSREIFQDRYITQRLILCLATSKWTAAAGSYVRMGVARTPNQSSRIAAISELTRVTSSLKPKGKHMAARSVTPSQYGKICPYETSDGRSCGLVTNCPPHTIRSLGSPGRWIKQLILAEYKPLMRITRENWKRRFFEPVEQKWTAAASGGAAAPTATAVEASAGASAGASVGGIARGTGGGIAGASGVRTAGAGAGKLEAPWEVRVEGHPLGWIDDPQHFLAWYDERVREGRIDSEAAIDMVPQFKDVSIRCDGERMLALKFVYSNLHLLRDIDWLSVTKQSLLEQGLIRYVDALEDRHRVTVFDEQDARQRLRQNPNLKIDFMEIDPSFALSFSTSLNPYLQNGPAVRACFQSGMNKHAISIDHEQYTLQKSQYQIRFPQMPYVHTSGGRIDNGIFQLSTRIWRVAIISTDTNPEDSFDICQRLTDLQGASSSISTVYRSSQRKQGTSSTKVIFGPLNPADCAGFKDGDHSKVGPLGIPPVGTVVYERDIIISRSVPQLSPFTNKELKTLHAHKKLRDARKLAGDAPTASSATSYRKLVDLPNEMLETALNMATRCDDSEQFFGKEGVVTRSVATTNQAGLALRVAEVTQDHELEEGDKGCSRHGQKGVCGCRVWLENMPYTSAGYSVNAVVAPASFPSRMTTGQLWESLMSKAIMLGAPRSWGDATPFRGRPATVKEIGDFLVSKGFMANGCDVMYDPRTGKRLQVEVFNGPIAMLLQRHLAVDKEHARGESGRVEPITGQPVDGRKKHGGQRIGEMEYIALTAHAATYNLADIVHRSGVWPALICEVCGTLAYINYRTRRLHCPYCKNGEHVQRVLSQPAFRVAHYLTMALGIRQSFRLTEANVPSRTRRPSSSRTRRQPLLSSTPIHRM